MTHKLPDKDVFEDLYYNQRMTIIEIAKKFGVGKTTIQRRFKKFGIKINRSFIPDESVILDDFNSGMTVKEIREKYNVSKSFVNTFLRNHGIHRKKIIPPELKSKEWLKKKIYDEHMLQKDIAELLGVTSLSVLWWKTKHGLETPKRFKVTDFHDKELVKELYSKYTLEQIADIYNSDTTTVSNALKYHEIPANNWKTNSSVELKVVSFLEELGITIKRNVRDVIPPYEIDIYLPEHNIGIEVNGIYWHSEKFKDKDYHKQKYDICVKNNIRLLQFWEPDIKYKWDIVKRIITNAIGMNNDTVYARNTGVCTIDKQESKVFLDNNHIQGRGHSSIEYGLRYNDELVAVMTFKKRSDMVFELTRYATSKRVIGGFSKLLSHFIKNNTFEKIVTFSDNMIFSGNVYEKCGFILEKELPPDYKYQVGDRIFHKFNFRGEKENTQLKVYDAGKKRWVYIR